MRRDYYRPNARYPMRKDHFHADTRRLPNGRVRVTMWESSGDFTGGPLDKTKVDFDSILEVLDMFSEVDEGMRAEGWERWQ
ncbi:MULTISPECIES: hypothetical protein [Streptomyces]|uniref:hypothetical protein n=1 Tax=Streptomyces TaxID=1883 RepID=UPI0015FFE4B0|nr:hypothetical protein [Streptomyces murinus]MBA9050817.1 hypothetical protein [Streptomyces murinus]